MRIIIREVYKIKVLLLVSTVVRLLFY